MNNKVKIHPTAEVSPDAAIGDGTSVWNWAQVREGAKIGAQCVISKGVYVDAGAVIGDRVKIQNNVSVFRGVTVEDCCFIGPHVCFTNDLRPRATMPNGQLRGENDWMLTCTHVRRGASIGANSTIVCGIEIGMWSMIGAGSVVKDNVPAYGLVAGNPARFVGYVCKCGSRVEAAGMVCRDCAVRD